MGLAHVDGPADRGPASVTVRPAVEAVPSRRDLARLDVGDKPGLSAGGGLSDSADIVYMSAPLKREPVLSGFTYKLSWPASAHALYITINDTETGGRRRPFEIFINTKTLEHHAWTVALTRMISAVFRRGGDVSFVVDELNAIVDPQGGSWLDGRYVPSLIAAIGGVIETHLKRINGLPADRAAEVPLRLASGHGAERIVTAATHDARTQTRACPRCSSPSYSLREGCWVCSTCGHSSCG
jgi:ribonucleoside-diphosphate reductase alpha chain